MDIIWGQRLGEWTRNYGPALRNVKFYVGKGIALFLEYRCGGVWWKPPKSTWVTKLLITGPDRGVLFTTLEEERGFEACADC